MIEDQDLGLVKEKKMPDVKAVASDLVSRGYTSAQAKGVIDSLGLNMELESSLLSEMDALAPQEASEPVTAATNPKPLPRAENISQAPTGSPEEAFDFEGIDVGGFDLGDMSDTTVAKDLRTELANMEIGTLAANYLGDTTPEEVQGDDALYEYAVQQMGNDIYQQSLALGEQRIAEAQTPEEVDLAVQETAAAIKNTFIPIVEFKKDYVRKALTNYNKDLPDLDQLVLTQHIMAGEADKATNRMFESATVLDILGDVGEILIPVVGVVEEEKIKFNNKVDEALNRIADSGSKEEQIATLQALVDDWATAETAMFGNNNSLINAGQIDTVKNSILQGGLARIEGNITDAEFSRMNETVLNVAFAGTEVAGLKGLFKFLKTRIFPAPKKDLERLYGQLRAAPLEGDLILKSDNNLLRSTGSAKHTEYLYNPTKLLEDKSEGKLALGFKDLGIKPEDAAMNHAPTESVDTTLGFADIIDDRQNLSAVMFADETIATAGQKRGLQLEAETGRNIRFIPSGTGFIKDEVEQADSLGVFKLLFGKQGSKGFTSPDEATTAAKNNVLGEDFEIVEKNGAWYIEVQQRQYLDHMKDVAGTAPTEPVGLLRKWFVNPLRQLGDDFMQGVFAMKGLNRVKSINLEKKVQAAMSGIDPQSAKLLYQSLEEGESSMKEWSTYASFLRDNEWSDSKHTKKAYEKYRQVREVMDDVYQIRNAAFTSKKRNLGYKNIKMDNGEFVLGRRTPKKDVDTPQVWDQRTGRAVNSDTLLDDDIVIKLDGPVTKNGNQYDHLVVNPEDVNKLPTNLLNKRTGHIDRMYRDTGWTIKVEKEAVVGGKAKKYPSTTHIVKTQKEADAILAKMAEEDPVNSYSKVRARENSDLDDIFSDTSSVQFTYGAAHTRARADEMLKGSDGLNAPLVDVRKRIEKAVRSAGRAYDVDIVESMRARFYKSFNSILNKGAATRWDNDLSRMLKNTKDIDPKVVQAADALHDYIKKFESMENSKFFSAINAKISQLSGGRYNPQTQMVSVKAQKFTSMVYIQAAPLFQIPQNFVQLAYVAMRHPVSGPVAAVQTPFVMAAMLNKGSDLKLVGKALGVSEDVARDLIDTIKASGLLEVGSADDFLSMTRKTLTPATRSYGEKFLRGLAGAGKAPLRMSQVAQEHTVKLVALTSYLAEFNKLVVRGGGKYNAKMKERISFLAQKTMNTQNGIDQFWYQNKANPLSMGLQFAQHMNKVFLDVVADPLVTAGTLGRKSLGRDKGALSENFGRALFTIGATLTVFGFDGLLGQKGGGVIEDTLRENIPDINDSPAEFLVEGGVLDQMINSSLRYLSGGEGAGAFTSRYGPGGFADYVNDKFVGEFGSIDMAGPFGGALSGVSQLGLNTLDILTTDIPIDQHDKLELIIRETASLFKGVKDVEKARIAMAMQEWPYWGKLSSDMRVTEYEGALAALSIPPQLVQDMQEDMEWASAGKEESITRINKLFMRQAQRELADAALNGTDSVIKTQEIYVKWMNIAYQFAGSHERERVGALWGREMFDSSTKSYQTYIKPSLKHDSIEEKISSLTALKGKATTEEAKQEIQVQIDLLNMQVETNNEVYK